MPQSFR